MEASALVQRTLEAALAAAGAPAASKEETGAVVRVFMLGLVRTGSEDPRADLRIVTDPLLEHLVKNLDRMDSSPAVAKVGQLFVIEWCWRNGYLLEDWRWEWRGRNSGDIRFLPRLPLSMIPVPRPDRS